MKTAIDELNDECKTLFVKIIDSKIQRLKKENGYFTYGEQVLLDLKKEIEKMKK